MKIRKTILFIFLAIILPSTVIAKSSKDIYGMDISNKEGYVKYNGEDILGKHYIVPSNSLNTFINKEDYDNNTKFEMGDFVYYLKSNLYIAKSVIIRDKSIEIELKDEFVVDDVNTIITQNKIMNFFKHSVLWKKGNNMIFNYTDVNGGTLSVSEEDYE